MTSYLRSQPTRIPLSHGDLPVPEFQHQERLDERRCSLYRREDEPARLLRELPGTDQDDSLAHLHGSATAKREVMAADYGIVWQATQKFSVSDQVNFSNVQQPGTATMTSVTTVSTPATAGNETINCNRLTTHDRSRRRLHLRRQPAGRRASGRLLRPEVYHQRRDRRPGMAGRAPRSRSPIAITITSLRRVCPHNTPLAAGATQQRNGHDQPGWRNSQRRSASDQQLGYQWQRPSCSIPTTFSLRWAPRQLQHYRVHTLYRAKSWATVSGAYNDMELHNNTNNIRRRASRRPARSCSAQPDRQHGCAAVVRTSTMGSTLNYPTAMSIWPTNICYDGGGQRHAIRLRHESSGTACPGAPSAGTTYYEFGPVKDFMDAPTNYGSAALRISPSNFPQGRHWLSHQLRGRQPLLQRSARRCRLAGLDISVSLRECRLHGPSRMDLERGIQLLRATTRAGLRARRTAAPAIPRPQLRRPVVACNSSALGACKPV